MASKTAYGKAGFSFTPFHSHQTRWARGTGRAVNPINSRFTFLSFSSIDRSLSWFSLLAFTAGQSR